VAWGELQCFDLKLDQIPGGKLPHITRSRYIGIAGAISQGLIGIRCRKTEFQETWSLALSLEDRGLAYADNNPSCSEGLIVEIQWRILFCSRSPPRAEVTGELKTPLNTSLVEQELRIFRFQTKILGNFCLSARLNHPALLKARPIVNPYFMNIMDNRCHSYLQFRNWSPLHIRRCPQNCFTAWLCSNKALGMAEDRCIQWK
jgi:hypothetical protein